MTNKYVGAAKFITNLFKGNKSKVPSTIKSVPPSKRNKTFGEQKETSHEEAWRRYNEKTWRRNDEKEISNQKKRRRHG